VGWAIQTGAEFKMDFITPGDRFGFGARYAVGASGFGGGSNLASPGLFGSGNQVAVGWITDGVFLNGTAIELTTTWTVAAAYEHYWTPQLKTSFSGAYSQVNYDNTAKGYWASNVCPAGTPAPGGPAAITGGGQAGFNNVGAAFCDPDWAFFQGGVRTQWSPSAGFFMGVDLIYTHIFTAFKGATANINGVNVSGTTGAATPINPIVGARPAGVYRIDDQGIFSAVFRAQRNFNAGD
jgi:hypothetical protein